MLRSSILEYMKDSLPDITRDVEVLIRVYCNMRGLSKTYVGAGVLQHKEDLGRFIHGFNMVHPLCDFIDAGDGKECSDDKIRGETVSLP